MKGIHIQTLAADEVSRAGEIDRTERMHVGYRVEDGRLVRDDGDWNSVPWSLEGDSHSVTAIVRGLEEVRADGGTVWGAFDGSGRLVGIASLRPRLTQTQAQMDLLHVSNGHRRCGIGSMLCQQAEDAARASGAREMYVSATPTGSAVGFYRSRGFKLTDTPDPRLWAQEPDDVHMILTLQPEDG